MEITIKIEKIKDGILSITILDDDVKPNFTLVGLHTSGIKIEGSNLQIGLGSVNPNPCGAPMVASSGGNTIRVGGKGSVNGVPYDLPPLCGENREAVE